MHLISSTLLLILIDTFSPAAACEGECIVGITNAFLGNYTNPISIVFRTIADQLAELVPTSNRPSDTMTFVQPILTAYQNTSYDTLETAVFPSYFHGKCQRFSKDGQDPPGCPDPDCPVVCGTPGSLVHFYSTLRSIVFNSTRQTLTKLGSPGSDAYNQVNALVDNAQNLNRKRSMHDGLNAEAEAPAQFDHVHSHSFGRHSRIHPRHIHSLSNRFHRTAAHARSSSSVKTILATIGPQLGQTCGSPANEDTSSLRYCSWETEMKAYILSFP